jgi:monofunctional glycosyltransferase
MQTARNLLLWPGRDPIRKALEAWLTPQIAVLWPKRRILEVYLNVVEFGPGTYGAEAAARSFFHKPAAGLSAREAALLASVLPRPLVWSLARPDAHLRRRVGVIERRLPQIRPLLGCAR